MSDDAIIIVRDVMVRRNRAVITAERIERLGLWHIVGRVDDELHDVSAGDSGEEIEEIADRMLSEIDEEYH